MSVKMEKNNSDRNVDVIIVGGGLSGMSSAYELKKKNISAFVLEAKDRLGGRTLTTTLNAASGKDSWDLGAQWVGTSQTHILDLIKDLGLETYPQFTKGSKLMQLGSTKITSYNSEIPSLSVLALIDLQIFLMKVDSLRRQVDPENPYLHKKSPEWDGITVGHYIQSCLWTQGAMDAVYSGMRALGWDPSHVSLLYALTLIASAGGLMPLLEAKEPDAQGLKIKGGTQQIVYKLLEKIGEENVFINHAVTDISQSHESASNENIGHVCVRCGNGTLFRCKRVIVAAPINFVGRILFSPPLPVCKQEMIKWFGFGNYIKVILTYSKAFWRLKGLSGEIVTNGGMACDGCISGPLCVVFDATSPNGNPALASFIGGNQAAQWAEQTPERRKEAVVESLSHFVGPEAKEYIDYCEKDWRSESFIEGAVGSVSPGGMPYFVNGLRQPFGRIHFAGAETASSWIGYMSGAVQSGNRAATEVQNALFPKSENCTSVQEKTTLSVTKFFKPYPHKMSDALYGILSVIFVLFIALFVQWIVM